jgi:drug/metabolite transporter (DMT)-like permease
MPNDDDSPSMGAKEWMMLAVLSGLWGASFFFFKILVAELPPFTIALGRVAFAAVALNLLLAARREALPAGRRIWASFAVMGLLNNVAPFVLILFGETRISSGLASILNATTPIFTVIAAHFLTANEKLNWSKVVGVLFGFLGVMVLIGAGVVLNLGRGDLAGELACLLASLSYAFASVYGRRFRGIAPLKVATGQLTASALILLPISALVDHPWVLPAPSPKIWLAFAGLSLLSTAAGYILYFRVLAVAGATNLALVTFLLPISAMTLGVLFLGESVSPQALMGMAIIGLGLAAIDGRLFRRAEYLWERRRIA